MTPRIVRIDGVKTPANVPNPPGFPGVTGAAVGADRTVSSGTLCSGCGGQGHSLGERRTKGNDGSAEEERAPPETPEGAE